jgi:hypothetical protein
MKKRTTTKKTAQMQDLANLLNLTFGTEAVTGQFEYETNQATEQINPSNYFNIQQDTITLSELAEMLNKNF